MEMLVIAVTAVLALAASGLYLRLAKHWHILDVPNARSAHQLPVPRGGGVAIYLALLGGYLLLAVLREWPAHYGLLIVLGGLLALTGAIDDRRSLPVWLRFALYASACLLLSWVLLWPLWSGLALLAAVAALWLLNLFNFMDGIDGIAASEAVFVTLAAAGLTHYHSGDNAYLMLCLLVAASSAGFLAWNWSPARLFMGDAGSVCLGFLMAGLALLGLQSGAVPLGCWLVLLAVFIADASLTLAWRAATGQRLTQAHSLHAYQRLARHWGGHAPVVWAMQAYNLCWLLPLAVASLFWPQWLWLVLVAAYLPLLIGWRKAVILP